MSRYHRIPGPCIPLVCCRSASVLARERHRGEKSASSCSLSGSPSPFSGSRVSPSSFRISWRGSYLVLPLSFFLSSRIQSDTKFADRSSHLKRATVFTLSPSRTRVQITRGDRLLQPLPSDCRPPRCFSRTELVCRRIFIPRAAYKMLNSKLLK